MKRFLSFFTALIVFLGITASANIYDDFFEYDELLPEYGQISADISISNNSDMTFLNCFDEYTKPYEAKNVVLGILSSKLHLDINYTTRKNRRVLKAYIKAYAESPIELSEDLYIDAKSTTHLWVHFDSTESENPKYQITLKLPASDKYYLFDSKYSDGAFIYPSFLKTQTLRNAVQNALRLNSRLGYSGNTYTLAIDDTGVKNAFDYLFNNSFEAVYAVFNGTNTPPSEISNEQTRATEASQRLKNISVLGNSPLTAEFALNGTTAEHVDLKINLDTNIFKLYYASTGKNMPIDPNAEKPAINADNSDIKMTLGINADIKNNYTDFDFPDTKNAYNIFQNSTYSMTYTTSASKVSPYKTSVLEFNGFPKIENKTVYLPLRPLLNAVGLQDNFIIWNEGNIHINSNSLFPYRHVSVTAGNTCINADDSKILLSAPPVLKGSVLYVPEDFVSAVIKGKILQYTTSFDDFSAKYKTRAEIEHLLPAYVNQVKITDFENREVGQ